MKKRGYLYILITAVTFSTMEIVLKLIGDAFDPVQMTLSRFLVGGVVLLPFSYTLRRRRSIALPARSLGTFAVLGLIGVALSMTFYQLAVLYCEPAEVATLFSANPVFVAFLAFLILHEPLERSTVIALVLEVVGIVLIINPAATQLNPIGVTFTLVASVLFALYGALGTRPSATYGGVTVTCMSFIFGSLELLVMVLLGHLAPVATAFERIGLGIFSDVPLLSGYSTATLPLFLYASIGITGIGYACWFLAMEHTSPNQASVAFFIKPVLATVLAVIIVHEVVPPLMVAGIAIMLVGAAFNIVPGIVAQRRERLARGDEGTEIDSAISAESELTDK
jgi:drug/metabolite transporter (DMT)-like permease